MSKHNYEYITWRESKTEIEEIEWCSRCGTIVTTVTPITKIKGKKAYINILAAALYWAPGKEESPSEPECGQ